MALQLSLPFEVEADRALRLWILAATEAQTPLLRRALADDRPEFLFESATGACPIGIDDAILLRLSPGRYEGFGATATLVANASDTAQSLTDTILAGVRPDPRAGLEMLAAWPGAPPHQSSLDVRTTLDDLFEQLGGEDRRPIRHRLEICERLIRVLREGQADLKRLLVAHAAVLRRRLGEPDVSAPDSAALACPPRWVRAIAGRAPSTSASGVQLSLFPGHDARRSPGIPGLGAFRVWGVSLPVRVDAPRFGRPRFLGPSPVLSVNEEALSAVLGPIGATAVVAVVDLTRTGSGRSLRISIEWELQQRLGQLFPSAPAARKLQVWVEDSHGSAVTVAKPIDVGQDVETPAAPLLTDGRIVGVVAFRTPSGFESRQPFTIAA